MSEDGNDKKLSKQDAVMRIILAAIFVGLLAVFFWGVYRDDQAGPPKGVLDVIPESTLKAVRD